MPGRHITPTLELAIELVKRPSLTPDQAGCIDLIAERFTRAGFECELMRFGVTDNLWATHGSGKPLLALAGHVDVVPTGPADRWNHPPFSAVIENGWLHGRGAADMKGGLAALVTAAERFVAAHPQHAGTLAFLITADEEGPGNGGTKKVIEKLTERGVQLDWCLLGEPSSTTMAGDVMRIGRRGSLSATLTVHGVQGHVAFPDIADNPVHRLAPALAELCAIEWDEGNEHFPPTSFQVSNLNAGTGADNVIPGTATVLFNLRFSTEQTVDGLRERVDEVLDRHGLKYDIAWHVSGLPFLTAGGRLVDAAQAAVREVMGFEPELNTGGGTSDGRHIAPSGAEVIELGPVNATIHKLNEHVRIEDLERLSKAYERIATTLLV